AIKYAKEAAELANKNIDFDSLLAKAESDIWEYTQETTSSLRFAAVQYNPEREERMHPEIEEKINTGQSLHHGNSALPNGYVEQNASNTFNKNVEQVRNTSGTSADEAYQNVKTLRKQIRAIEQPRAQQLEQIAIKIVEEQMGIQHGEVDWDIKLGKREDIDPDQFQIENKTEPPQIPSQDLGGFQIRQFDEEDIKKEVDKRRIINSLSQGAAQKAKNMFFFAQQELSQISPQLTQLYKQYIPLTQYRYWVKGDPAETPQIGGAASFSMDGEEGEEKKPCIHATATNFVVLLAEMVKGAMELVASLGLPDEDITPHVFKETEDLKNERWDIRFGQDYWDKLLQAMNIADPRKRAMIFEQIVKLPAEQFNSLMKGVLSGDPAAKQKIQEMVDNQPEENNTTLSWDKDIHFYDHLRMMKYKYRNEDIIPNDHSGDPFASEGISFVCSKCGHRYYSKPHGYYNGNPVCDFCLSDSNDDDNFIEDNNDLLLESSLKRSSIQNDKYYAVYRDKNNKIRLVDNVAYDHYVDALRKEVDFRIKNGLDYGMTWVRRGDNMDLDIERFDENTTLSWDIEEKDNTISVTREDLKELERLYNDCPDGGVFKFKGQDVLKSYAKYLIEYLKMQFNNKRSEAHMERNQEIVAALVAEAKVVKEDGNYDVKCHGKTYKHDTKEEANAQERAIQVNKHKAFDVDPNAHSDRDMIQENYGDRFSKFKIGDKVTLNPDTIEEAASTPNDLLNNNVREFLGKTGMVTSLHAGGMNDIHVDYGNGKGLGLDVKYFIKSEHNQSGESDIWTKGSFIKQYIPKSRMAADISDQVPPMGWENDESKKDQPTGAGAPLPPNQNLQNEQPTQNNKPADNVLYDSNQDSGPQFQTTVNPKDKSVTVKFVDSPEEQALNEAIGAPPQAQAAPAPGAGLGNPPQKPNTQVNPNGELGEKEVPISF
ncbi:MAG: hypothetical protein WC979_10010, partial [Candidatus Pacearchaeota archaeon]